MSENAQETPDERQRSAMLGHLVRRGIPILLLLVVVGAAFLFWRQRDDAPEHVAAAQPAGPIPVSIVTVQPETVPVTPRFLGQTEGSQVVEIRARVAGYLGERSFAEGERVQQGQKLFQIDPRPFEVQLAQARARLASAQATQQRAKQQVARYEELAARQSATAGELEEWQMQESVAAADVELQKALIAGAELELSYTSIEAPITGMIGQALKDTGSYVDAGQNGLLAVIHQIDPIYVRFPVTEQEMLRHNRQVASGQLEAPAVEEMELEITLADGTTYPHRGRINFVDVQVDETTGTSLIRGTVPNPNDMLKPGQFIHVTVLGIKRLNAMRVPQVSVVQNPTGASVYVVNDQGMVEVRPVTLGNWTEDDQWIIEQGLEAGDRVITDRLMMVRPGMAVTVAEGQGPHSASQTTAATQHAPREAAADGEAARDREVGTP